VSGLGLPDWKSGKKPQTKPQSPRDWSKRQDGQTPAPTDHARQYIERIRAKLRGQRLPKVETVKEPEEVEAVRDVPLGEIPF